MDVLVGWTGKKRNLCIFPIISVFKKVILLCLSVLPSNSQVCLERGQFQPLIVPSFISIIGNSPQFPLLQSHPPHLCQCDSGAAPWQRIDTSVWRLAGLSEKLFGGIQGVRIKLWSSKQFLVQSLTRLLGCLSWNQQSSSIWSFISTKQRKAVSGVIPVKSPHLLSCSPVLSCTAPSLAKKPHKLQCSWHVCIPVLTLLLMDAIWAHSPLLR